MRRAANQLGAEAMTMTRPETPQNLDIPKEFLQWMRGLNDFDLIMLLSEISEKNFTEALPVAAALKRNQQAHNDLKVKLNPAPNHADLMRLFFSRF